jgi:hypothetical protein
MSFWTEKIEFPELGRIKELSKEKLREYEDRVWGKYHCFNLSEINVIDLLILKIFMDKAEISYNLQSNQLIVDGIDLIQKLAILEGTHGRKYS